MTKINQVITNIIIIHDSYLIEIHVSSKFFHRVFNIAPVKLNFQVLRDILFKALNL